MADVDAQKALAAGYSQAEIDAENARRRTAPSPIKSVADQDAALRAGGGLAGDEGFFSNVRTGVGKAFSDMGLAAQQLAASVGGGDKEALAAEAADREKRDAALMNTGGGMVGKYGTDVGTSFLPLGAFPKVAKGAGLVKKMIPVALGGAAQEVLTPDESYNPLWQATKGAALGIGGEGVGRAVGRVLSPIQEKASGALATHLENLEGMPKRIAENLTDNKFVKAMSNALAMTPAGGGVNASRKAQAEAFTEAATEAAGKPMKQMDPEALLKLEESLKSKYNAFDRGPDVSLADLPAELQPFLTELRAAAKVANSNAPIRTLQSAIAGSEKTVPGIRPMPPGVPPPPPGIGAPGPAAYKAPVELSAKDALDLRSLASKKMTESGDEFNRGAYGAVKEALENAIAKTHTPEQAAEFRNLNKQWGAWERLKGAGAGGYGDTVKPEDFVRQLPDARQIAPKTDLEKLAVSQSRVAPSPSLTENRALWTRILSGAGLAGAGAATGTLPVVGGSLALAHALLGTEAGGRYVTGQAKSTVGKALQSEKMRELLRQLGYAEATN